ncbi:MAG: DUF1501 domain-containing protein [Vicinamibacteria bacterium]|nr:DUF1501 domain-containing protein [Vicinamibacteria bacterium]
MPTRRFFLRSSGLAFASFGLAPRALARAAAAVPGGRGKTLVVLLQRGACDGLNVVIPYAEKEYAQARPTIALAAPGREGGALDLDGHFGLHPALEPLLPLWREGSLAAVHAVGSPHPTRSHFDAQDFLESGTPGVKSTRDGWMNRQLQAQPAATASPLRAVAISPTLPRALQGRAGAVALTDAASFELREAAGTRVAAGFEGMYAAAARDALGGAARETFGAIDALADVEPMAEPRTARGERAMGPLGARRRGPGVGAALREVARLVRSDLGVELAFVEMDGWDHHSGEGGASGQLAQRLRELGEALAGFHETLGSRMSDVAVVVVTEFGRTLKENGARGTDHGHGSVALVLGGPVRGGRVVGRWPGLREDALHEGRDLAVTTDFRDLLGELLVGHLGARDLSTVFPGHRVAPPGLLRG